MEHSHNDCGKKDFNYCKVAKICIAIPALPLVGVIGASFFNEPWSQMTAGAASIIAAIAIALVIDRIPVLRKKMRPCSHCDAP